MRIFLPCLYSFFACAAFCVIFEIKKPKMIFSAAFCGAAAWLVFLLCARLGVYLQYIIATVAAAALAELFARVHKAPATIFLIIGIVPLVPGSGIFYTMSYLIAGRFAESASKGLETLSYAGAIAVGCSLVFSLVRISQASKRKRAMKKGL